MRVKSTALRSFAYPLTMAIIPGKPHWTVDLVALLTIALSVNPELRLAEVPTSPTLAEDDLVVLLISEKEIVWTVERSGPVMHR